MRRFFAIVVLILVFAACSKDSSPLFDTNGVNTSVESSSVMVTDDFSCRVLLSHQSQSQVEIEVGMVENWYIEMVYADSSSPQFTVSKATGTAYNYEKVAITATTENVTEFQVMLGSAVVKSSATNETIYTINVEQSRVPAAQTTLTYFTGTHLNSDFRTNISDVKVAIEGGILGSGGRYFYLLPSSSTTAKLCEITLNSGVCQESEIKEYSSFRSLDEGSIAQVIEDVKSHIGYDAIAGSEPQRMNLVISGHGTGWVPSYATSFSSLGGVGYANEWEHPDAEIQTRYMGCTADGFMNIDELVDDLESTGVKFGYILFDECFMSSVELLYRVRELANYIIASPCEVMSEGFPYQSVMPKMFTNDGQDFDLEGICQAYYEYYESATYPYGCVATCVTSELESLATMQKALNLRALTYAEVNALQSYEGQIGDHTFFDLKQYVNSAADQSDATLLANYNAQFDAAFPEKYRKHTDKFFTNIGTTTGEMGITYYSGVTTSAPTGATYYTHWTGEPWAKATLNSSN